MPLETKLQILEAIQAKKEKEAILIEAKPDDPDEFDIDEALG